MQSFSQSSIPRKQRKDWWQEIKKYCHQLIEECNKHGHPPTHRFVHPQTIIDTFIKVGVRPPNNLRGLNKLCDNFISKPIATGRHVQNKLRSEYLVFGYCRLFSQLFNVHIPLDVATICFQWYFYTTNHISVFVRFKPRKTVSNGFVVVNILKNNKDVQITHPNTSINPKPFTFNSLDYIFDWNCKEKQVFDITTKNLVYSLFEGYNATVICYDNGKCGKIFSAERKKGCIPRAIKLIYELIKLNTNTSKYIEYSITMSYLRLYCEQITDLLNVNNIGLRIRNNTIKGMCIDNITTQKCENEKICNEWIKFGDENMNICGNKNCNCSPASFSKATYVLIMNLHQIDIKNLNQKVSKLMFVDLECSGKWCGCSDTGIPCRGYYNNYTNFGSRVNSLRTLRNVMSQLSARKRHISYKDSVLTDLLMDSLGGNCKTSLIINCSPPTLNIMKIEETIDCMMFATTGLKIENKPKINVFKSGNRFTKLFDKFDKNKDGKIDFYDLKQTLFECGEGIADNDVHKMISIADTSGKGYINYREFVDMIKNNEVNGFVI